MGHQLCSPILAIAVLVSSSVGPALSLELELPIACVIGQTCFVQNYVDHDLSSGARDYMCGHQTYDGPDGTDFRLPSMAQERTGVAVRAAADGQVYASAMACKTCLCGQSVPSKSRGASAATL